MVAVTEVPFLEALPGLVEPLGALWVNAIRMTVIPLVVGLIVTGIASTGDAGTVGRIGGGALVLFLAFVASSAAFALLAGSPLLSLIPIDAAAAQEMSGPAAGGGGPVDLPPFRDWLVDLIPPNLVQALASGAMLPIIVGAVLFGLALARVPGESAQSVIKVVQGVVDATFVLIHWILEAAPVGVFGLVFPMVATLGVAIIGAFGWWILCAVTLVVVANLALYPVTAMLGGVSVRQFARAVFPAQVVGFSTRSSLASLPALMEGAEELALPPRVSGLALPAAVSVFKFSSPITRITGTLFVAQIYGIQLGGVELLLIVAALMILSFYSPGIPSGGLFVLAPVYLQFGLPVEGIGLLIALDLIPDMFITVANVTADLSVATILGRWSGDGDTGGSG